jgi:hypothetical protein
MTANALAVVPAHADSVEPRSMPELLQLASAAAKTGFFGAKSPEQALLVMMSGRDLGLSYSQALRAFHVIEGKPSLSADGMVAACLVRRDVCEFFRTLESTNERATVETKRVGQPAQSYTFAMSDAERAGLRGKANWQKYPSRMLLARARAALARDVYPDLLLGLYDPDELTGEVVQTVAVPVEVVEERPAKVQAAVQSAREAIDAAPKVAPVGQDELREKLVAAFLECGSGGTMADYRKLASQAAKLSQEDRLALSPIARQAKDAIAERESFQSEERQPGQEG